MTAQKPRIVVIGAGPAGLSAAAHLLEEAGDAIRVEVIAMGHQLGGKAASWRDEEGYCIDQGFHTVFGFYEELRALLRRAGVDLQQALVPSHGVSHYFDPARREIVTQRLHHNALLALLASQSAVRLGDAEKKQLHDANQRMAKTLAATPNLESLDDVCLRAFLLEHGAPPSALDTIAYRQLEELTFNAPHEVSAYIVLHGAKLLTHCYDDAVFSYIAGGISEQLWDPVGQHIRRLGGTIHLGQKLMGLDHAGGKLTGLRFGLPDDPWVHDPGQLQWPLEIPIVAGSESADDDFAAVICTLPVANFLELNPGDPLWEDPYFEGLHRLTSVPTLSLQIWLRHPPRSDLTGAINGIGRPLGHVVDLKPLVDELDDDARYGAALQWVGPEDGFETQTDAELIQNAREQLAAVPGFEGTETDEVVHLSFTRNRDNHQRLLLTDPGTLRFRPHCQTPLEGLLLAGDWVRNEIDIPTMEGAVRCGKTAAKLALQRI